ncbi:MAG: calcium/sodium antiporter [Candidatus Margulisiibacteriota bacterium]
MLNIILLIIGFICLVKGADILVGGASSLARRLKVSDMFIGLTVVAFGTSMPELFVNITASILNKPDIAMTNIIGSNIANLLLILGVSAAIYPLAITGKTVWVEIPISLVVPLLLLFFCNDQFFNPMHQSYLSRPEGIILLILFICFMYYVIRTSRQNVSEQQETHIIFTTGKSILLVVSGLLLLMAGGRWIVDGAVYIAKLLNVSETLIGLTIVAVGTSLPELATSAAAAYRKNADIAMGNVLGSNIFNVLLILGTSAIIRPLPVYGAINFDIGILILAHIMLFIFMFTLKKHVLDRKEGYLYVIMYTAYIAFLIFMRKG